MAGGYVATRSDDYSVLVERIKRLSTRLSELEAPTGTQVNSLVAQVQLAIANINTTVAAAIAANSYTKSQIDSKIASPGAISPSTVTASGTVSVGGQLLDPDAATFNITGTRLTVWVETATGRLGNTASSRKYKQDEVDAPDDPTAILSVEPKAFHYIAEIRKRDDPTFEGYIGPDYVVALERGLMAEDLHAAGLTPWVIYGPDGSPESVDYVMFSVAQQLALRHLAGRVATLEQQVAGLTA